MVWNKGTPRSEVTRKKISDAMKGENHPLWGKHHSKTTIKKMKEAHKGKFGEKAGHWKGGKVIIDGYIYIYSPTHPFRTKMNYVCEHRLVIEKKLGRYLLRTEVVHHKDGNRLNNHFNNLELIKSTGKHCEAYHSKRGLNGRFVSH